MDTRRKDFSFVKDVVAANVLAAQSDACGIFNISRGEAVTINHLAELINKLVGSKVRPVHQEPRPGDVKHSLADISRAKVFGYQPEYNLEVGLAATVEWFNDK